MRRIGGYLLTVTGLLACPCHLPLLAGVLAGTSLGAWVAGNTGPLFALLGGYFVVAVLVGVRLITGATGLGTGAAMSLIVDEGMTPMLGFSAPNSAYPLVTHLRGFVAHLAFGLGAAATAETIYWLGRNAGTR